MVETKINCEELEEDHSKLGERAIIWQMTVEVSKCKVICTGAKTLLTLNRNYDDLNWQ